MKRSMFAAVAVGFGLLASMAGAQAASPLAGAPAVAAANAAVAQGSTVTKVWFRRYGPHGAFRPGYGWRPGVGWVPLAVAGAVVAGAAAGAYYADHGPYYYGPGPYGPAPYGPGHTTAPLRITVLAIDPRRPWLKARAAGE